MSNSLLLPFVSTLVSKRKANTRNIGKAVPETQEKKNILKTKQKQIMMIHLTSCITFIVFHKKGNFLEFDKKIEHF